MDHSLNVLDIFMLTDKSIFSTSFFSWDSASGSTVVSSYIWILVVAAAGLTSITVGTWYLATFYTESKDKPLDDHEKQSIGLEEDF
jgi:NADH:ubiquinone oxidoreductase subunit 5 (subunit L)/multisubunit Na+/H+ antiporter MnhA subunit